MRALIDASLNDAFSSSSVCHEGMRRGMDGKPKSRPSLSGDGIPPKLATVESPLDTPCCAARMLSFRGKTANIAGVATPGVAPSAFGEQLVEQSQKLNEAQQRVRRPARTSA